MKQIAFISLLAVFCPEVPAATGPSSTQAPYLLAQAPGVEFTAILSAGDAVPLAGDPAQRYRMTGTPDGLGAYDNDDGTFSLLMNHELPASLGAVHAHGGKGAFVSQWRIRKSDLAVLSGQDLIQRVLQWDEGRQMHVEKPQAVFASFCSADLAASSAFYNRESGKGWHDGRWFLNGEEKKDGRAFAHLAGGNGHGSSYELPRLGRHSFENVLASPHEQDRTVLIGTEDGGDNKLHVYVGDKQAAGGALERAGLMNGKTWQLRIEGYTGDDPVSGFRQGRFNLGEGDGTALARPEDGVWDRTTPGRFYFVTTSHFDGNSRLWQLQFDDIGQPERGGEIRVLVDGARSGAKMLDNLTLDEAGNLYLQEDVGQHPHLGRIWQYQADNGTMRVLAGFDPERFSAGGAGFLTENEESSGIIEVTPLFKGVKGYNAERFRYFLLDVQAHYALPGEVVAGGQLLLMKVPR